MTENDDGGWGDLFAKASEISTNTFDNNNNDSNNDIHNGHHDSKERKHRKRKRQQSKHHAVDEGKKRNEILESSNNHHYQAMLQSRMTESSSSSSWPAWIQISGHLCQTTSSTSTTSRGKYCKQWKQRSKNSRDNNDNTNNNDLSKCDHCNQSALYHCIKVNKSFLSKSSSSLSLSQQSNFHLEILVALRNIRCCAKMLITFSNHQSSSSSSSSNNNNNISDKDIIMAINDMTKLLSSLISKIYLYLPSSHNNNDNDDDEAFLLQSKMETVSQYSRFLRAEKGKKNNKHDNNFKMYFYNSVRLIIACDAVYYRLYYLQLTRKLHTITNDVRLPHPDEYFGLDYLTQDIQESRKAYLKRIKDMDHDLVMKWSGSFDGDGNNNWTMMNDTAITNTTTTTTSSYHHHPLARIWLYRYYETCTIFYQTGWMSHPSTMKSIVKTIQHHQQQQAEQNYDNKNKTTTTTTTDLEQYCHETPAPSPLSEWRDSCRDFMCNLYAYATLSPFTICEISKIIKQKKQHYQSVIEIGAGTGYIAKLLRDEGINIEAWDIHPTTTISTTTTSGVTNALSSSSSSTTMNEYHGDTPSFVPVQKSSLLPITKNNKNNTNNNDMTNKILLLCYPPPQSSMAVDTLQSYQNFGGTCLIHIGEFKGLTGNSKFEHLLLKTMKCQYRFPCLSWGTDASHVTIWESRTSSSTTSTSTNTSTTSTSTTSNQTTKKQQTYQQQQTVNDDDDVATTKPPPPPTTIPTSSKIFLPCIQCQSKEATRRCRLLRTLVYCSLACFENHSKERTVLLQLHMIETTGIETKCLNFTKDRDFYKLE